jgi:hypothetical protein
LLLYLLPLCPLHIRSLYMVLWSLAPMVYRRPCLWYIDPYCLWYFNPTTQVMINPYLCYIKPYGYDILILPMVFWPAVSKSGNPGPGPVPKTWAQIRIFFITSLLRH